MVQRFGHLQAVDPSLKASITICMQRKKKSYYDLEGFLTCKKEDVFVPWKF